jgi:GH35 family endo-1,4-beta-xylanase
MDVVNEYGAAGELDGWGYYLGRDCVKYAFETAREHAGNMKLYYNSFFPHDDDVDLAIEMLPYTDGIGVQLHLDTWNDNTARFDRIRRMADACKAQGKSMRFSEVSVRKQDGEDMMAAALVYRDIVRLALEYPQTIVNFTTWGVKGKTWNGGYLLFDTYGKPNTCYSLVVKELLRKE